MNSKEYKLEHKIRHNCHIGNFLILKDGRLSVSNGASILILNIKGEIELEIKINSLYHAQLSDGDIISSIEDGSMMIIKILENNSYKIAYEFPIAKYLSEKPLNNKLIELENGNIISIYSNSTLVLW